MKKYSYEEKDDKLTFWGDVGRWFQTICISNIPVIGMIYMIVVALNKNNIKERRRYAVAYIIFRCLILILTIVIIYVLYKMGLDFIDGILQYAGMDK